MFFLCDDNKKGEIRDYIMGRRRVRQSTNIIYKDYYIYFYYYIIEFLYVYDDYSYLKF